MNGNAVRCGALLILAMSCCAAGPEPVRVDVTMIDYRFLPEQVAFEHGVHYRLHLENHGKETHEFTAPVFFAAAKLDFGVLAIERFRIVELGCGEKHRSRELVGLLAAVYQMQAVMNAVLERYFLRQEAVIDHGYVNPGRLGRCGATRHCKK